MDDESNEAEVDEVNEEAIDQNSDEVIVFEPHTVLSKGHMKSLIWKFFVFKGTLSKGAVKCLIQIGQMSSMTNISSFSKSRLFIILFF